MAPAWASVSLSRRLDRWALGPFFTLNYTLLGQLEAPGLVSRVSTASKAPSPDTWAGACAAPSSPSFPSASLTTVPFVFGGSCSMETRQGVV